MHKSYVLPETEISEAFFVLVGCDKRHAFLELACLNELLDAGLKLLYSVYDFSHLRLHK